MSPVATRVDRATGARQDVGFFGQDELVFTSFHLPAAPGEAGLIVCPPVASEFEKNYRRETLLAWNLAARGVAVGRFHYRGAGQSDGEAGAMSLESMVEDAVSVTERFVSRTNVRRLAFLGTRVGSVVAAGVARRHGGAPLALWEPVLDGESYFRDVFRASFMADMRQGPGAHPSQDQVVNRLRREGWVDIVGSTIGRPLYESLVGRTLEEEMPDDSREVLLVQLGRGQRVRAPHRHAAERLERRDHRVDVRVVDEVEAWWFGEERRGKAALTATTAEWLVDRLGAGVAP